MSMERAAPKRKAGIGVGYDAAKLHRRQPGWAGSDEDEDEANDDDETDDDDDDDKDENC